MDDDSLLFLMTGPRLSGGVGRGTGALLKSSLIGGGGASQAWEREISKAAVAHPEAPTFFALKSFETHLMRDVISGGLGLSWTT